MKKEFKKELDKHIEREDPRLTEKEFNLSSKIEDAIDFKDYTPVLMVIDVKEFIKKLKKEITKCPDVEYWSDIFERIDKLCGEKLR